MGITDEAKEFYYQQRGSKALKIYDSEKISQVILIRHGEPDVTTQGWYSREKVILHDKDYRLSSIKPIESALIDPSTIRSTKIYHSSLRRASHTAELLFGKGFNLVPDPRFREFERGVVRSMGLVLPLKFWKIISRLFWFAGIHSKEVESVKAAGTRARINAEFLSSEANKEGVAVLVAHGWHNRYVSKYLKKEGWEVVFDSGRDYLGMQVLLKSKK